MLGLDPLYMANEGKCLLFLKKEKSKKVLNAMRKHALGKGASVIGEVTEKSTAPVLLRTRVGGTRILPMLTGEQLPRIC